MRHAARHAIQRIAAPTRALLRPSTLALALVVAVLVAFPARALADIVFTGGGQSAFGVDASGASVSGTGTGQFTDALDRVRSTEEGKRIEQELDEADVEVTIDVVPDSEVANGTAYGTARITERDPETGKPTKILIKIGRDDTGGVANLADTLQHELRHAEIFLDDNDRHKHSALDGGHDALNVQFRGQVAALPPPTPTPSPHPNFDRIMGEASEAKKLADAARMLGDILGDLVDSISSRTPEPAFDTSYIDIKGYGGFKVQYTLGEVTATFNESVFECGDASGTRRVVCPDDVKPMPAGDVIVIGMVLASDVPLSDQGHSFIYSAVFDSDGDAANNWRPQPPFDWDYFGGTDRWYQLVWDHLAGEWLLTVTQVSAAGQPQADVGSTVRAVIDGDVIVFFIAATEFAGDGPTFRVSAFGHDGGFGEQTRGGDVSGADPTEALAPLITE